MAEPPVFERVLGSSLFVMARGPGDPGWAAYLIAEGRSPPGAPISVTDGLERYDGHFLLAPTAPPLGTAGEVDRFTTGVYAYLDASFGQPNPPFRGSALVWIPDPAAPRFGDADAYAFTIQATSATSWTVASDLNNTIGGRLTMSIPNRTEIAVGQDGASLVFAGSGVGLETTEPGHAPAVDPPRATLPFAGPYSGCLLFGGELVPAATLGY
ncbi:MAG: hypothetical protein M3340_13545, partial [Actinomycetota bacterium]|nr:hypothetical protein [Actinomycetota bacterium]